jgi:hypothetical protein
MCTVVTVIFGVCNSVRLRSSYLYLTSCKGRAISGGWSPASHRGVTGSSPGHVIWDLWWTKWRWGRFSPSTSVSPANLHSNHCSRITIIYHLGVVQQGSSGRSAKWTQSRPTNNNNNNKMIRPVKCSVNPITNPNPVCSHTQMHDSIASIFRV